MVAVGTTQTGRATLPSVTARVVSISSHISGRSGLHPHTTHTHTAMRGRSSPHPVKSQAEPTQPACVPWSQTWPASKPPSTSESQLNSMHQSAPGRLQGGCFDIVQVGKVRHHFLDNNLQPQHGMRSHLDCVPLCRPPCMDWFCLGCATQAAPCSARCRMRGTCLRCPHLQFVQAERWHALPTRRQGGRGRGRGWRRRQLPVVWRGGAGYPEPCRSRGRCCCWHNRPRGAAACVLSRRSLGAACRTAGGQAAHVCQFGAGRVLLSCRCNAWGGRQTCGCCRRQQQQDAASAGRRPHSAHQLQEAEG